MSKIKYTDEHGITHELESIVPSLKENVAFNTPQKMVCWDGNFAPILTNVHAICPNLTYMEYVVIGTKDIYEHCAPLPKVRTRNLTPVEICERFKWCRVDEFRNIVATMYKFSGRGNPKFMKSPYDENLLEFSNDCVTWVPCPQVPESGEVAK